jgi:hypothetical protein
VTLDDELAWGVGEERNHQSMEHGVNADFACVVAKHVVAVRGVVVVRGVNGATKTAL